MKKFDKPTIIKYVVGFILLVVISKTCQTCNKSEPLTKEQQLEQQLEQKKQDSIDDRESKIDMALTRLKDRIKSNMKDPDSYEVITRTYDTTDKGDTIKLMIRFRGNNSFGGKTVSTAYANYYIKYDTIEVKKLIQNE